MSNWVDDSESAARPTPPAGSAGPPVATQADPGWYSDPWTGAQHRYWDGSAWTAHTFADGPGTSDPYPGAMASQTRSTPVTETAQWGPEDPNTTHATTDWSAPPTQTDWQPPSTDPSGSTAAYPSTDWSAPAERTDWWASPPGPPAARPWDPDPKSNGGPTGRTLVALLVLLVLVVGGTSMGITYLALRRPSTPAAQAPLPTTTVPSTPALPGATPGTLVPGLTPATPATPTAPADPVTAALAQIVVNQADVASTVSVQPLVGGAQVSGETTLDLCNGTFPSEALRSNRLQVAVVDTQDNTPISTEAVAYKNTTSTAQAFNELKATAANCPSGPVVSPVGEPAVTTKFNTAPDASWPQVAGVDRLAFDFTTLDSNGQTHHSVAAYLRRGRFLMGIYFSEPDSAQIAVSGQTTIPGIVNVFAVRLAAQPAALAGGTSG